MFLCLHIGSDSCTQHSPNSSPCRVLVVLVEEAVFSSALYCVWGITSCCLPFWLRCDNDVLCAGIPAPFASFGLCWYLCAERCRIRPALRPVVSVSKCLACSGLLTAHPRFIFCLGSRAGLVSRVYCVVPRLVFGSLCFVFLLFLCLVLFFIFSIS